MSAHQHKQEFERIIDEHKGILFKVVRTYCAQEADRPDLMQEILVHLWTSFPKYNPDYKLTTWIYRISLNVAISFYRKAKTRRAVSVELDVEAEMIGNDEQKETDHQLKMLTRFINELRELDRSLLFLYLEQRTYKEIAEILGISETNVATKIGRIKVALRKKFLTI